MKLLLASTALAVALGFGAHMSDPVAAQQYTCDENDDGFVDATEARLCTERAFDELGAGEPALTAEHLNLTAQDQEGIPTSAEVDENGDGTISRAEWLGFSDRRFAGATEASGGRMSAEDYERWREGGMQQP